MPIYEFFCPDNQKIYSFFARSLAYADKSPRCPDNSKFRMERMISNFSFTGRARESSGDQAMPDENDPRFQATMNEMEREFSSMNEENPDPRQIARMMRKMATMTGEKMTGPMEEMMQRLEKGENLDKLDEEFGEMTDDLGTASDTDGASDWQKLKAQIRAGKKAPVRDPSLYEMSEFVDLAPSAPGKKKASKKRTGKK